jgi:chitin disaccharide deacetylase
MKTGYVVLMVLFTFFNAECKSVGRLAAPEVPNGNTQAELLGYPQGKKILILHADDAGMCSEANAAIQKYLLAGDIQSTAVMMPCAAAADMIQWAIGHPQYDVGIHSTLTSEWKTWRWGPVCDRTLVPGLLDPDGFMWKEVIGVVLRSNAEEVDREIRSQINAAITQGWHPSHLDTHMGTVYGKLDFSKAYLKIAMDYKIPAMVPNPADSLMIRFRQQGYPITEELIKELSQYPQPRLDDFQSIGSSPNYAQKKNDFYKQVKALKPGLTEIIFHPAVESDALKQITNSWQQRVWEGQMFSDAEVKKFLQDEGIIFTNWREVMKRYLKYNSLRNPR